MMLASVRQKIFFAVLGAILLAILGMALSNLFVLRAMNTSEVIEELERAGSIYTSVAAQHRRAMELEAYSLAAAPQIVSALSAPNPSPETLSAVLRLRDNPGGALLLLDVQGGVVAAPRFPDAEPGDTLSLPGINGALDGLLVNDVFSHAGQLYLFAMTAVTAGDKPVGLAVVAVEVGGAPEVVALRESTKLYVAVSDGAAVRGLYGELDADLAAALRMTASTDVAPSQSFVSVHGVRVADVPAGKLYFLPQLIASDAYLLLYSAPATQPDSVRSLAWLVVVRGGLGLLAGALFAWWLSSLVIRPARAVTVAAEKLGAGDASARAEWDSRDEFGKLAKAFNAMADHLTREQSALLAQKDAAEAASRAKSTFLATMSHEIRTPLNGVLGLSQLVTNSLRDPDQLRNMELITKSGRDLLDIINDILDFSKIEAGKLELAPAPLDLSRFVADLCQALAATASAKGLELNCNLPPETAFQVQADGPRLRRILVNLIGNAIKFTEVGHVDVSVQLLERQGNTARFKFEVADTGIGIEADKVDEIFDAFSQADGATSRNLEGTGLGLAISRQLVELMGGELAVSSVTNRGSCFSFTLGFPVIERAELQRAAPVNTAAARPGPSAAGRAEAASAGAQGSYAGARILVVEDGDINQEVARAMLEWYGCEVDVAVNGRVALQKTASASFDLIFMDCHMPEMDGYEATRKLRRREQETGRERTPIIALTANAVQGDREACLAAGMDDYIAKPFTDDDIGRVLRRWLV